MNNSQTSEPLTQWVEQWILSHAKHSLSLTSWDQLIHHNENKEGHGFAPVNIALCKYWGKRDNRLNLPVTNSLSISLMGLGASTQIQLLHSTAQGFGVGADHIEMNGEILANTHPDAMRISNFLNYFRGNQRLSFKVITHSDIPIASGLASSASGFAALTLALDHLFGWEMPPKALSVLARLGSGSACRSLWPGFVEWQKGNQIDGSDSHGLPLDEQWPEFRVGLWMVGSARKKISSRQAMLKTMNSPFYSAWSERVEQDLKNLKAALQCQDFEALGCIAEANALAMHGLMMTAHPPIVYSNSATLEAYHHIWQLRAEGLPVYFTQDAGPHLKLLFQAEHTSSIMDQFPGVYIISPFSEWGNANG